MSVIEHTVAGPVGEGEQAESPRAPRILPTVEPVEVEARIPEAQSRLRELPQMKTQTPRIQGHDAQKTVSGSGWSFQPVASDS